MSPLEQYYAQGLGVREIAALTGKSKSTIAAMRKEALSVALDCIDLSAQLEPADRDALVRLSVASLRRLLRVPA